MYYSPNFSKTILKNSLMGEKREEAGAHPEIKWGLRPAIIIDSQFWRWVHWQGTGIGGAKWEKAQPNTAGWSREFKGHALRMLIAGLPSLLLLFVFWWQGIEPEPQKCKVSTHLLSYMPELLVLKPNITLCRHAKQHLLTRAKFNPTDPLLSAAWVGSLNTTTAESVE